MKIPILLCLTIFTYTNCHIILVSNGKDLASALKAVNPGDIILMADGLYNGELVATRSGTPDRKITLQGSEFAVVTGHVVGIDLQADHWMLYGFSIVNYNKGILLSHANNNILDSINIAGIHQKGIHLNQNSSSNIIRNCVIQDTAKGIFIGQPVTEWINGEPDRSDGNQFLNNIIRRGVRAKCIVINEGSCCGLVQGNTCDGNGTSSEIFKNSAVDVAGDQYLIENNVLDNMLLNGIEVSRVATANVVITLFRIISATISHQEGNVL